MVTRGWRRLKHLRVAQRYTNSISNYLSFALKKIEKIKDDFSIHIQMNTSL